MTLTWREDDRAIMKIQRLLVENKCSKLPAKDTIEGHGIDKDMELAEVGEEDVLTRHRGGRSFPLPCVHRTRCRLVPLQQRPKMN